MRLPDSPLVLIDKPQGMTSHDVVNVIRRMMRSSCYQPPVPQTESRLRGTTNYQLPKVGHAGTLDPFATGLLIVGIGPGTKKLAELVGLDKEYEATLFLGATSETFDPEGPIHPTVEIIHALPLQTVEQALDAFRGGYEQLAPLHSAKKIHGKKLYELARQGKATQEMRPKKFVKIDELKVLDYSWPRLTIRVVCSSGTYIRSLADDIGRELKTGAYLTALRRTRIGPFSVTEALPLSCERLTK